MDSTLDQPNDNAEGNTPSNQADDKLQTRLVSKTLQSRLLRQYYEARSSEEEQGVNIHYLAIGFLKWFEADSSTQERNAPLLLIPIRLERQSAGGKFKIEALDEEITTNLSLQAKLLQEFNISIPDLPELDDLNPSEYFREVRRAIAGKQRWQVLEDDMVLWFFSFAKFLMYRDLDPDTWPEGASIADNANINAILNNGFRCEQPILREDDNLDAVLDPANLFHVVDADGSQSVVIEEVRRGRHVVVQGPPGTGKSQTITNMIAAAVKEGKKVLFVAEKMAALDVVKSRMDKVGLGQLCLELHSHKANKKAVLAEISETLDCKRPKFTNLTEQIDELRRLRDELNSYAIALHQPLPASGLTAYQVIGELVRLQRLQVPAPQFTIEDPLNWEKSQFERKLELVQTVAALLERVGNPQEHPWKGVGLSAMLPAELQGIAELVSNLTVSLKAISNAGRILAKGIELGHPKTPREVSVIAVLTNHLLKAPSVDLSSIVDGVWDQRLAEIAELVELGARHSKQRGELEMVLEPSAWSRDVSSARKQLKLRGTSWFRWLKGEFRRASKTLEEICVEAPPISLCDRIALLDQLLETQRMARDIDALAPLAKQAFGAQWQGTASDWLKLRATIEWVRDRPNGIARDYRQVLSKLKDKRLCGQQLSIIGSNLKRAIDGLKSCIQRLAIDIEEAFGVRDVTAIPLDTILSRFQSWLETPESVQTWIAYRLRLRKLPSEGLSQLANQLHTGKTKAIWAHHQLAVAYYESLIRECFRRSPNLAEFTGETHEAVRAKFRQLDTVRAELARKEVAFSHFQSIPKSDEFGEMAKVRNELQKRRRHWPIRRLLKEAGHALQAIKPVFMMSPTSIAQFLEPGVLRFDLLLIDEASQVRPVEAMGALARCKQIVVVGDDKQMPPTAFFTSSLDASDDLDEDSMNASDLESILGLCIARNVPSRMLSWHYRSKHQSLIAVSNYEFYHNKLFVIPNPEPQTDGLGLRLNHVKDGVFDRGQSATNRVEARQVAEAVMEHAKMNPSLSLGVGAFSIKQRDAILDELEVLRREHAELEAFFGNSSDEPFFVKNLENLQGDERDVIFISVGYGPDKDGYFSMSFGPLSREGGERRLNVLITRSRIRCEVFSSLRADDIDLVRATSRGAAVLKRFLKYAETGWLDVATPTEGEHDSVFEEQVAAAIREAGYEVDAQVGVAGFFIDLAVKDPDKPGRYLLGIECDGATYHSARWARDRDRLRQDVLESRKWQIHRIWSTDWFRQPREQMRKLLAAIELAKKPAVLAEASDALIMIDDGEEDEKCLDVFEADEPLETENNSSSVEECCNTYREATVGSIRIDATRPLYEMSPIVLAEVAYNVVSVEGPVHREEIARRIAAFWGAGRTSKRMIAAVDSALSHAIDKQMMVADGEFFTVLGQEQVEVRSRASVISLTLRQPEMLPPAEITAAIYKLVTLHVGLSSDECIVGTGRLFGYRSTGSQLKHVITRQLDLMIERGQIRVHDARLFECQNVASLVGQAPLI